MKRLLSLPKATLVAALVVMASGLASGAAFADDVVVTLTGVRAGGQILGALQTEDQFLKPAGTYGAMSPSKEGSVVLIFKGVKPGTYSLSVLQDDDGDKTMTLGADGKPVEGWAMKNGANMKAKPTWAESSFAVGAKPMAFSEPMIYPKK